MFVSAFADAIPPAPECRYKDTTFPIYNGTSDLKIFLSITAPMSAEVQYCRHFLGTIRTKVRRGFYILAFCLSPAPEP